MRKKYLSLTLGTLIALTLTTTNVWASPSETKPSKPKPKVESKSKVKPSKPTSGGSSKLVSVGTIKNGDKQYAPINTIVQQMGGQVQRDEANKSYTYSINGKTIRIDDQRSFAEVDGEYIPFETRDIGEYKVPVFKKPVIKDGNEYVPVDFLKTSLGLKLDVKDGQVAFDAVDSKGQVESGSVATVTVPSNGGTSSTTGVVESNRPATNPSKPSSGGSSSTGGTTKPSGGNTGGSQPSNPTPTPTPKPQPQPQPKPQPTQKVHTGSQVKQKLYGLGFVDHNGGLRLNPNGSNGSTDDDSLLFDVLSGSKDMNLAIAYSSPEIDQKIKTIFNYILPTQGGRLYSILDNPNCKSQTIELDGRTIQINVASYVSICFGPIKK